MKATIETKMIAQDIPGYTYGTPQAAWAHELAFNWY